MASHSTTADYLNPEVPAINVIDVDNDGGPYANKFLLFPVDPTPCKSARRAKMLPGKERHTRSWANKWLGS
jgi:hypothetical protein